MSAAPSVVRKEEAGVWVLRLVPGHGSVTPANCSVAELDAMHGVVLSQSPTLDLELRWRPDEGEERDETLPSNLLLQQVLQAAGVTRFSGGRWPPSHATVSLVFRRTRDDSYAGLLSARSLQCHFAIQL